MAKREDTILFFDGSCSLCSRWVRFARKRDREGQLKFAPIGGETWTNRFGGIDSQVNRETVHLVNEKGHFMKSSAVIQLLYGCSGGWPLAGFLLWLIPRPLRNLGYGWVAMNRYRLFGKTHACPLASEGSPPCMLP